MEAVEPVFAYGFFHVAPGIIYYTIVFEYAERDERFRRRVRDPGERKREEESIARELQRSMDEERTLINGREVRPLVDDVSLVLMPGRRHSVVAHVRMAFEPVRGRNVYENFYEPTIAPYPYVAYWVAPPGGKILSVESPGIVKARASGRIYIIRVPKGEEVPGYESVVFTLPMGWVVRR